MDDDYDRQDPKEGDLHAGRGDDERPGGAGSPPRLEVTQTRSPAREAFPPSSLNQASLPKGMECIRTPRTITTPHANHVP